MMDLFKIFPSIDPIDVLADDLTDEDWGLDDFLSNFPSWQDTPMQQWSSNEVLDFLESQLPQCPCLSRFQCISGNIFVTLSEQYCQLLSTSEEIGSRIYQFKENHLKQYGCAPYQEEQSDRSENGSEYDHHSNYDDKELFNVVSKRRNDNFRRKSGKGKGSEKLWQFLINLLTDRRTCPDLIRWENFEEGTFKFIKSDKVAQLWGSRKKNRTMTYEKFSRAMRYYYKSKVLLPVPGKRLVYKFGPHAKGWNTELPIC